MDSDKQKPENTFLSLSCNNECELCGQKARCIVYAFGSFGSRLVGPGEEEQEDYELTARNIQDTLEKMINMTISGSRLVPSAEYGAAVIFPNQVSSMGIKTGTDLEAVPVLHLSREFTDRIYGLLKEIRQRRTIPVQVLISLRELQRHHILVTTKLCRAVAGLIKDRTGDGRKWNMTVNEANMSLVKCRSALVEINGVLPEKKLLVSDLLDLSEKIQEQIRLHFS